jgi:hypothetical protein
MSYAKQEKEIDQVPCVRGSLPKLAKQGSQTLLKNTASAGKSIVNA